MGAFSDVISSELQEGLLCDWMQIIAIPSRKAGLRRDHGSVDGVEVYQQIHPQHKGRAADEYQ